MKALILVGGEATRLLPLTSNTPKAMVPVLNRPFLEHVIGHLSSHNVKDIILTQSCRSQQISDWFGDGSRLGVNLSYTIEDTPMGTAGAIKHAERYLDETFLVLNGDIITNLDIAAMVELHLARKAKVTIALTPVDDPTSYGLVETDAQGKITRFLEKPGHDEITTNMINAGTYLIEPGVLKYIPAQTKVSIERETFPLLLARDEPAYTYLSDAYWLDMGTPEKYLQLQRDLLGGHGIKHEFRAGDEVLISEQSSVHATAQVRGPVLVDGGCSIGRNAELKGPLVIGAGCTVLEDTVIEDSIIWRDARIGPNVILKSSIVADSCHLNSGCNVEGSVLGDNVTVASGSRLKLGSKIEPGTTV